MKVRHIPWYTAILLIVSTTLFIFSPNVAHVPQRLSPYFIAAGAAVLIATYLLFIYSQNRELFVSQPRALEFDPNTGNWTVKIAPNVMDKSSFAVYIEELIVSPSDDLEVKGIYESANPSRSISIEWADSRATCKIGREWNFGSFVIIEGSRRMIRNDVHSLTFALKYRKVKLFSTNPRWILKFMEDHTIR